MSATLDVARVAELLEHPPVIESPGRSFPVDIRYRDRPGGTRIEDAMVDAIRDAYHAENGSILAFLPGQAEIRRVAERLQGNLGADTMITRSMAIFRKRSRTRRYGRTAGGARWFWQRRLQRPRSRSMEFAL